MGDIQIRVAGVERCHKGHLKDSIRTLRKGGCRDDKHRDASFNERPIGPAATDPSPPSSDLKPETSAFNDHGSRRAPTRATRVPAYRKRSAIFRSEDEYGFFHAWQDNDALRSIEQIAGDPAIGGSHHVGQRIRRSVQPRRRL